MRFCYWTVADGNHGKMAATTVASARKVGVTADFHIWTDIDAIPGAIVHPCGKFDKTLYMFKFHFLKNEVAKLDYDYFVFFDADTYFVKDPGDLTKFMAPSDKVFVQMENDCTPSRSKRKDWWSCPINEYGPFLKEQGANSDIYYNTNAGFWIVRKDAIDEFYERTTKFFDAAHKRGYKGFTEEPALAFVGHIMQDPKKRAFEDTSWLWASDWTGQWKDRLPEYKEWQFEDYMSGEKKMVKPFIVHCMRSKDALIKEYESNIKNIKSKFDVLMCCYGDYPNISNNSIDMILNNKNTNFKIHIALNACGEATKKHFRELFDSGKIHTLLEFNDNINKDPAMRKLIDSCTSEYFLWLDDDTYPIKNGWDIEIEKSITQSEYDVGGFTHVSSRNGYSGYKKFLETRKWFKGWDEYKKFNDQNLNNDNIPFPIGFLWVGRVDYFIDNNFPDRDMIKKCDDMLLGEMIYQTQATFKHLGDIWAYFEKNKAERRGVGEYAHDGWKTARYSFNGLTIYPTGSMCNRLRNALTSYMLCKENGIKLKWLDEISIPQMAGIKFSDYWEIPKDIDYVTLSTPEIMDIHNEGIATNNIYRKIPKNKLNGALHNHWGISTLDNEDVKKEGLDRLKNALVSNVFPLKQKWDNLVKNFVALHNIKNCVGVHMRSFEFLFGERTLEQNNNMISNFVEKLPSNHCIFLATDSKYVQHKMKTILGDRCVYLKDILTEYLNRESVEDFEHGLLDFYILSNCKKVYGTKGSSYSHLAGIMCGDIEWVIGARDSLEWEG